MSDSTLWWLLAGATVALELYIGTFYLLMLALGMTAGALAAHAGLSQTLQVGMAAGVGSAAVLAWYFIKKRGPNDPSPRAMRSVNLDVGEIIQVEHWQPDGTASVKYRGASWTVIQHLDHAPTPGAYRVTELVGNRLLVEKA